MTESQELALALEGIRKKLVGKSLSYKEIYAIMDEISKKRMGDVLTTYFAASGYSNGFSNDELYYLTKAMVETGEQLHFSGIVADKHSIGGVPGTRTTLIVIPIIAAAGITIPKSSSRAITTPDGTADDMEVLAGVSFNKEELYSIVKKTNGCIVWGGSFDIAPADDILIQVEKPLMLESFDKILVSIMAKKIAFGSNHIVIDLPYGKSVKLHNHEDAKLLKEKFEYLAGRFDIKLKVLVHETPQPVGQGIGPVLECIDALRVLEQHPHRPSDLEDRAIHLAGELLDLCLEDFPDAERKDIRSKFPTGKAWATHLLQTGAALKKMMDIIEAQGGDPKVTSISLHPGKYAHHILAHKHGTIAHISSSQATTIAKILGAPIQKGAGLFFHKKIGDSFKKGDILMTLYSENTYTLKEGIATLANIPIISL